jgi:hypothetical protein
MRAGQALELAGGRARHRGTRSSAVADIAIHPIHKQGKFRRALATVGSWLVALDYTGFDYILDRIERLERELIWLKEELRQSREASSGDAHLGGAVNLEH